MSTANTKFHLAVLADDLTPLTQAMDKGTDPVIIQCTGGGCPGGIVAFSVLAAELLGAPDKPAKMLLKFDSKDAADAWWNKFAAQLVGMHVREVKT